MQDICGKVIRKTPYSKEYLAEYTRPHATPGAAPGEQLNRIPRHQAASSPALLVTRYYADVGERNSLYQVSIAGRGRPTPRRLQARLAGRRRLRQARNRKLLKTNDESNF